MATHLAIRKVFTLDLLLGRRWNLLFISLFKRQQRNRCVWIQLKGPILPKCNDLTGAMKCNKETIFYLLMPSYKSGTWIGQVLKKTPARLEMLQAWMYLPRCATLFSVMPNTCWFLSGRRSHRAASVPWKPQRLERKQLLRSELWLGGRTHFSLTSLRDSPINTDRFMGCLTFIQFVCLWREE